MKQFTRESGVYGCPSLAPDIPGLDWSRVIKQPVHLIGEIRVKGHVHFDICDSIWAVSPFVFQRSVQFRHSRGSSYQLE